MDTLLRFGSGSKLHTFVPDDQVAYWDNFRDVVPRTSRLPGLSGGFDEYGSGPAPTEIGNVHYEFWIFGDTPAEVQSKKDALGRMRHFGKLRLYKQPVDPIQPERYCEARVNSIPLFERSGDRPDKQLKVSMDFRVDNPRWLTVGAEAPLYNDGSTYNSGVVYGGNPVTQNLIGLDNTFSVTPTGNEISFPRFLIDVPATKSASDIRIQREVNGSVVDEVHYAGTLAALDLYEINTRAYSVFLNGADGYDDDFAFITSAWFRLIGGESNTIRVLMANAADEITLQVRYFEAYNV